MSCRRAVAGATLLLALLCPGFENPAHAASDFRTIVSGGLVRTYRVYRPSALTRARSVPLVVMLHGGFGNGRQAELTYHWDQRADAAGFVVAYPDGIANTWNAGTCCGPVTRIDVDDVGFVRDLIHRVSADERIDPARVYVTGISNGAMLSYRVACELPHTVAAIGPVAGTMTVDCQGATPTSVLHIHGLADANVPYEGGRGDGFARDVRPSVPDTIARWRRIDGCGPARNATAGSVHRSVAACARGREVTLITIDGAGHQWPGSEPPGAAGQAALGLDDPSSAMDATRVLWQFFTSKRR